MMLAGDKEEVKVAMRTQVIEHKICIAKMFIHTVVKQQKESQDEEHVPSVPASFGPYVFNGSPAH